MNLYRRNEPNGTATRRAVSAAIAGAMLIGSLAAAAGSNAAPAKSAARAKPAAPAKPAVLARHAGPAKPVRLPMPAPLAAAVSSAPDGAPSAPPTLDGTRAIRRARAWTDTAVPYSQTGYRGGYRRDCSGFVSMAWDLPDNLITWNLPMVSKPIGKDDLRAGDILLNTRGGAGGRHAVIFEGWADAGKTKYVALEQSGGPNRAVRRVVAYPYEFDKNLYKPYRYAGMSGYERAIPKRERQLVDGWADRKAAERRTSMARAAQVASATGPADEASAASRPVRAAMLPDAGVLDRFLGWLGL